MELSLCGLAVVLFALWEEFELAVKAVGKMTRNSRLASRTDRQHDYMTCLPTCLASLPRYQKIA
ncbi:MAG: hypothetical protein HXX17_09115 [Geobacteraceae bacterium]|nr:hypothetical protein [Geobacteraceae bacterium]